MSKLKLTLACGNYDRTRALMDGTVQPEGIDLNYLPLIPGETFWRMLNNGEFDVSEMSLSSYTILRSKSDERFIALPVFPSRIFRHSCIYIRSNSGIQKPEDLKGKRIGIGDYQMTAAVWIRGLLQDDYQVRPQEVQWVMGKAIQEIDLPPDISIEEAKAGSSLEEMLENGELDALGSVMIHPAIRRGSHSVRRLFENSREVETDYYRRTGIFPIMHTIVLKTELLHSHPWVAISLYKAFVQAKEICYNHLYSTDALTTTLPWLIEDIEITRQLMGRDFWDYSIKGSLPTLDALTRYLEEQGLTKVRMNTGELFVPNIRDDLNQYLRGTGEV